MARGEENSGGSDPYETYMSGMGFGSSKKEGEPVGSDQTSGQIQPDTSGVNKDTGPKLENGGEAGGPRAEADGSGQAQTGEEAPKTSMSDYEADLLRAKSGDLEAKNRVREMAKLAKDNGANETLGYVMQIVVDEIPERQRTNPVAVRTAILDSTQRAVEEVDYQAELLGVTVVPGYAKAEWERTAWFMSAQLMVEDWRQKKQGKEVPDYLLRAVVQNRPITDKGSKEVVSYSGPSLSEVERVPEHIQRPDWQQILTAVLVAGETVESFTALREELGKWFPRPKSGWKVAPEPELERAKPDGKPKTPSSPESDKKPETGETMTWEQANTILIGCAEKDGQGLAVPFSSEQVRKATAERDRMKNEAKVKGVFTDEDKKEVINAYRAAEDQYADDVKALEASGGGSLIKDPWERFQDNMKATEARHLAALETRGLDVTDEMKSMVEEWYQGMIRRVYLLRTQGQITLLRDLELSTYALEKQISRISAEIMYRNWGSTKGVTDVRIAELAKSCTDYIENDGPEAKAIAARRKELADLEKTRAGESKIIKDDDEDDDLTGDENEAGGKKGGARVKRLRVLAARGLFNDAELRMLDKGDTATLIAFTKELLCKYDSNIPKEAENARDRMDIMVGFIERFRVVSDKKKRDADPAKAEAEDKMREETMEFLQDHLALYSLATNVTKVESSGAGIEGVKQTVGEEFSLTNWPRFGRLMNEVMVPAIKNVDGAEILGTEVTLEQLVYRMDSDWEALRSWLNAGENKDEARLIEAMAAAKEKMLKVLGLTNGDAAYVWTTLIKMRQVLLIEAERDAYMKKSADGDWYEGRRRVSGKWMAERMRPDALFSVNRSGEPDIALRCQNLLASFYGMKMKPEMMANFADKRQNPTTRVDLSRMGEAHIDWNKVPSDALSNYWDRVGMAVDTFNMLEKFGASPGLSSMAEIWQKGYLHLKGLYKADEEKALVPEAFIGVPNWRGNGPAPDIRLSRMPTKLVDYYLINLAIGAVYQEQFKFASTDKDHKVMETWALKGKLRAELFMSAQKEVERYDILCEVVDRIDWERVVGDRVRDEREPSIREGLRQAAKVVGRFGEEVGKGAVKGMGVKTGK